MGASNSVSEQTQQNFDIASYTGTWYELAKYPIIWERDCVGAMAEYTWDEEAKELGVRNSCISDGKVKRIRTGKAKMWDSGKFVLRFTDGFPSDGPSPYWVHWTDYNNYSIVGGPSGKYLWFLGRKDTLSRKDANMLLDKASDLGYTTSRIMANPSVIEDPLPAKTMDT